MGNMKGGGDKAKTVTEAADVDHSSKGREQEEGKGGKKGKPGKAGLPQKKEKKADSKFNHPQNICTIKGHSSDILSFRFGGSCKVAASVAEDRKLIVWDMKSLPPGQLMNMPIELVGTPSFAVVDSDAAERSDWSHVFVAGLRCRVRDVSRRQVCCRRDLSQQRGQDL